MSDLSIIHALNVALQAQLPAEAFAVADLASPDEALVFEREARGIANASASRRNEFLAGRRCARRALESCGGEPCAILSGTEGVPSWPMGIVGSISHSRGMCCAVVGRGAHFRCLGVDLEKTTRLSPRAMGRVLHAKEVDFVGESQARGSLIFSAKEAFYKAQYPIWKASANFQDLALSVDEGTQTMTVLEVATHLPNPLREASLHMQFTYRNVGDYVATLCWIRKPMIFKL